MAWRGPGSQMSDPRDDAPGAVPEEVVNQAKAAFGRRRPGDIAVLVWDSLVDDDDAPEDHRLVFEHPDVQIEVRVRASAGSSDLEGRVKPAGVLHVELQSDSEEVLYSAEAEAGAFKLKQAAPGVVRLALRGAATPLIRTDWFRI
jgi:hypothetical protein